MTAPRETPATELLKWRLANELSQYAAADMIETSRLSVIEIEKGERAVTPQMAVKLEKATGIDALKWLWWDGRVAVAKIKGIK